MLDVSRLAGIVDYEPAELVLTARPATPLAEIEAALAEQRPDARLRAARLARPSRRRRRATTLGGVLACNLAGSRRVRAGAARDHVLGFSAVNGCGEVWKAGGKVVKNVTGYDMCKLLAGSYGTLVGADRGHPQGDAAARDSVHACCCSGLTDDVAIAGAVRMR